MPEQKPALVALRDRREEVIDVLSSAYATSTLDEETFEERVTLAHRAGSVAELDALVEGLVVEERKPHEVAPAAEETRALVPARARSKTIVSIMGGVDRKGSWRVPERLRVFSLMGGADLDFREARLPPGVTEVWVSAIMGGVDIIVPPELAVEADGWAIMGGFDAVDRCPVEVDETTPILRIRGFCLMGGVDIVTRLPGESSWQARRRRRREQKQLRDAAIRKRLAEGKRKGEGE